MNSFGTIADLEELRPALNLLCSAIQENDLEPHSKHFSEQLLSLTLTFLTKQLEEIFVHTQGKICWVISTHVSSFKEVRTSNSYN